MYTTRIKGELDDIACPVCICKDGDFTISPIPSELNNNIVLVFECANCGHVWRREALASDFNIVNCLKESR